jgi:hypothetical protein
MLIFLPIPLFRRIVGKKNSNSSPETLLIFSHCEFGRCHHAYIRVSLALAPNPLACTHTFPCEGSFSRCDFFLSRGFTYRWPSCRHGTTGHGTIRHDGTVVSCLVVPPCRDEGTNTREKRSGVQKMNLFGAVQCCLIKNLSR